MPRIPRLLAPVVLMAALLAPAAKAAELSPAGQRALKYLLAVQDGIRKYHIDGEAHTPAEYARAAWEAMVRVLEAKGLKGADEEKSKLLVEALRRAEMEDLERLVDLIDRFAARAGGVDVEQLADVGARGMFLPLQDPFSAVMDEQTLRKLFQAMTSSEDKTVGLSPTRNPDGTWAVGHVRGGFPAEEAGVRIGDRLIAIEGVPVESIAPTEVAGRLMAEEGQVVRVTVQRKDWARPHVLAMRQGPTRRQNVQWALLPGRIGYVRALLFNMTMAQDVERALASLEGEGMRGLVLDLRGNPGGALPTCVAVAEKFLGEGREIATIENRHPWMRGREVYRASGKGARTDLPLVVLIDRASASASEMLSGTLKANGRATVVGETSYGKGVGQSIVPLGARLSHHAGPRMLYITLMQYFLPGDVKVQHVGVIPDVAASPGDPSGEVHEAVMALRDSGALEAWAKGEVPEARERFRMSVGFCEGGIERLPGVVEFLQGVETPLPPDVLERELFRAIRAALEQADGKPLLVRPREDAVLRRGIVEMCAKLGIGAGEIPEYGFLFRRGGVARN
jgi:carboxyl-terminal processing protease